MAASLRARLCAVAAGAALLTSVGCSGGSNFTSSVVNQAIASFAGYFAGLSIAGAGVPLVPVSADFNGDGLPDLAFTAPDFFDETGQVVVQFALAPGQFGEPVVIDVGAAFTFGLDAADFDEDGFPDLATADGDGTDVLVILNNGDGTFAEPDSIEIGGTSPTGVVAADFNEDGFADIATTNEGDVSVLLGNGDGTFDPSAEFTTTIECPLDIKTADMTGEGNLDLLVTDECGNDVNLLEGNGDGSFEGAEVLALGEGGGSGQGLAGALREKFRSTEKIRAKAGGDPTSLFAEIPVGLDNEFLAVADFNGDDIRDFAVSSFGGSETMGVDLGNGEVIVVLGLGGGTFGAPASFPMTGGGGAGLAAGDFNGDGRVDLACNALFSGETSIFLGDGTGAFDETDSLAVGTDPAGLICVDLNLDGRPDLVSANQFFANLTFLRGQGDGTFIATPRVFTGEFSSDNPVASGDLHRDGFDDLVVGMSDTDASTLAVLHNDGSGNFTLENVVDVGGGVQWVALGDMNGDGFLDAVIARDMVNEAGVGMGDDVAILLGDGEGGFGAPTGFPLVVGFPGEMALTDLDRDGDLDVAVAVGEAGVAFALGDGEGSLGAFDTAATGIDGFALAAGDWNGDGFPDLAVAGSTNVPTGEPPPPGEIAILINDAGQGFVEPTGVTTEGDPLCITNADLNGDGFQDLAIGSTIEGGKILPTGFNQVFLGDGEGGFTAQAAEQTGVIPSDLQAADVNGDGRVDLISFEPFLSSVIVAFGNGDATFDNLQAYNGGNFPVFGAVGNFNGDGFPDIAASNDPPEFLIGRTGTAQVGNDRSAFVGILNSLVR